jgi:hypothetical protein
MNLKTSILVIDLRGFTTLGGDRAGAGPAPAAQRRNCPPRTPLPLGPRVPVFTAKGHYDHVFSIV